MYLTPYDPESLAALGLTEDEFPNAIEYDIMHNKLGYSDEAIRAMGRRQLDDIVADYGSGVERRPGQVLSLTDPTKVTGTALVMREPTDVARETFNRGVALDLSNPSRIAARLRELPDSLGIGMNELLKGLGLPDLGDLKKYAGYAVLGVGGLAIYKVLRTFRIL